MRVPIVASLSYLGNKELDPLLTKEYDNFRASFALRLSKAFRSGPASKLSVQALRPGFEVKLSYSGLSDLGSQGNVFRPRGDFATKLRGLLVPPTG